MIYPDDHSDKESTMTAREELTDKIARMRGMSLIDFNDRVKVVLSSYRVQMKRGFSKPEDITARNELAAVIIGKNNDDVGFNVVETLYPFRIQDSSKGEKRQKPSVRPRDACDVVSISEYRENITPISYGYVAGGPAKKGGSQKVCPKCKSIGLHLAKGYKERYYSCVYCGFHQELEAETYQY